MSIATAIIGNSGTGKTASLRNLDGNDILLIQAIKKPLPFKNDWKPYDSKSESGTIKVTDNSTTIIAGINKAGSIGKKIIIIDDFQYVLSNEFMRRSTERGYDKFTEIARHGWDVMNAACNSGDNVRVYIICHSAANEYGGDVKMKTIGKLLDEKIVLEGMLSIVLRTHVESGKYMFSTQNNGADTVKTPMGMFGNMFIANDLKEIDKVICDYYDVK